MFDTNYPIDKIYFTNTIKEIRIRRIQKVIKIVVMFFSYGRHSKVIID